MARVAFRLPYIDRFALLLWFAVVAVTLIIYQDAIAGLKMLDPDDYLRLVQVRDLMAGQNWFDISQYRINPAAGGGLIHWSRFVDVQIAALVWLFSLILDPEMAERWAVTLYPQILLLPLFLLLAKILEMLGDRRHAIAGLCIAATAVTFQHYFVPLRIDHHNWQLLLSVAMLWLALGEPSFRRGLAAALLITIHIEISLEGLPYLAIFGALFALDWLRAPSQASRLHGFAAGLLVIPTLWLLVLRGWTSFTTVHCDTFSLPYATGVAAAALVLFAGLQARVLSESWQRRAILIGLAGVAGAAAFLIFGQSCLRGPFGDLEPLVRTYWYDRVLEGQPIWAQEPDVIALFFAPTLVGLGASIWAWTQTRGTARAENWTRTLFVILCSSLLSMMVFRTGAVTHAYMVPAFGAMGLALWEWSRARSSMPARIFGAMFVLLAIPAVDSLLAEQASRHFIVEDEVGAAGGADVQLCPSSAMLAGLGRQPATLIFAPIDIGPTILARTPHSVIATGHHRNHAAMNQIITVFLSDPAISAPIVKASGAQWLTLCTQLPESKNLARAAPGGLAARLAQNQRVSWLEYDGKLSSGPFRVYRVKPRGM